LDQFVEKDAAKPTRWSFHRIKWGKDGKPVYYLSNERRYREGAAKIRKLGCGWIDEDDVNFSEVRDAVAM
jgi:hypothetical protein